MYLNEIYSKYLSLFYIIEILFKIKYDYKYIIIIIYL